MPVIVTALDHLVLNVADVARSAAWYQQVLGMEVKVFDPGHGNMPRTSVSFGAQKINLRPVGADKVERGLIWYGATRAMQIRRVRLPKPLVKRGEPPH